MKRYDVDYRDLKDNSYNQESMTMEQITRLRKNKNIIIYQIIDPVTGRIIK